MTIPAEYLNQIVTGDARVLAERIPDNSVDLIFTDPVYENIDDYRWLAETAARVLTQNGNLLAYCAHTNLDAVMDAMRSHLYYRWLLIQRKFGVSGAIFGRKLYGNYIPLLWFGRARSLPVTWAQDLIDTQPQGKHVNFKWSKNPQGLMRWLQFFSTTESTVLEPNCGGGAIPAMCKATGRNYIAFEIDPATADRARARVAVTQAMHPVFLEEQHEMELVKA